MDLAPVVFAYGAGLLAALNPCGFVLLPTYATAFLSQGSGGLKTAAQVSARLAGGFLTVFTLTGLLVGLLGTSTKSLGEAASWLGAVTGLLLIASGLASLFGMKVPGLQIQIGSTKGAYSYGVGYAFASLACALPVFLGSVVNAFNRGGFVSGVASGVSYAAGMGTLVGCVVFLSATARKKAIVKLRSSTKWFSQATGLLLVTAGVTLLIRRWAQVPWLENASTSAVEWLDGHRWLPAAVLLLIVSLAAHRQRKVSKNHKTERENNHENQ
jgi:cytochrome c-type biogenesis protein